MEHALTDKCTYSKEYLIQLDLINFQGVSTPELERKNEIKCFGS